MRSGLRQLPQHLLDEEHVAIRARVYTRRQLVAAQHRTGEFGHVIHRQAAQINPVERAVALQLAQRRCQRGVPAELGVPIRPKHEDRSRAARAQDKARKQQASTIGPVKVVDHEQQRTARDEIGKSRVDGVEHSVSRAAVVSAATRLKGTSGASLRQRLGVGLERCQWLFGAATQEHGGALLDRGGIELLREARLADPGLTRDQRDLAIAVHLHAAPAGAQPRQFGAAADEHGFMRAGESHRWRHGVRLLAAEFLDQGTCLARGRDAKLRAQALAELAGGEQRGGTVAGCGKPLDHPTVRRFRERVKGDLGAGQPYRLH
jgi:hypothetical protein